MKLMRWIAVSLACSGILSGCSSWVSEDGCPTCFYDYSARYSIHGCHTWYDQTCWVNCNSCHNCQSTRPSVDRNYWKGEHATDQCRGSCCACLNKTVAPNKPNP